MISTDFNDYEVVSILGNSIQSSIYKVINKNTSTPYIWKAISYSQLNNEQLNNLKEIIHRRKCCENINLIKFYDPIIHKETKILYVVTEYCDNNLTNILKRCGKNKWLTEDFIWHILYKIICIYTTFKDLSLESLSLDNVFVDKEHNLKFLCFDYQNQEINPHNEEKYSILGMFLHQLCTNKLSFDKTCVIQNNYSEQLKDVVTQLLNLKSNDFIHIEPILQHPAVIIKSNNYSKGLIINKNSHTSSSSLSSNSSNGTAWNAIDNKLRKSKKFKLPSSGENLHLTNSKQSLHEEKLTKFIEGDSMSFKQSNANKENMTSSKEDLIKNTHLSNPNSTHQSHGNDTNQDNIYNTHKCNTNDIHQGDINNSHKDNIKNTLEEGTKTSNQDNTTNSVIESNFAARVQNIKNKEFALRQLEEKLKAKEYELQKREKKIVLAEKLIKEKTTRAELYLKRCRDSNVKSKNPKKQIENLDTTYSADCGDSIIVPTSKRLDVKEIFKPASFMRSMSEKRVKFKGHSPLRTIHYTNNIQFNRFGKSPKQDKQKKLSLKESRNSVEYESVIEGFNEKLNLNKDNSNFNKYTFDLNTESLELHDPSRDAADLNKTKNKSQKVLFQNRNSVYKCEDYENGTFYPIAWNEETKRHAFDLLRIINSTDNNDGAVVKETYL